MGNDFLSSVRIQGILLPTVDLPSLPHSPFEVCTNTILIHNYLMHLGSPLKSCSVSSSFGVGRKDIVLSTTNREYLPGNVTTFYDSSYMKFELLDNYPCFFLMLKKIKTTLLKQHLTTGILILSRLYFRMTKTPLV